MFTLITNNKDLLKHVSSVEFIEGSALDVLVCVRNLVHSGSKILTHPLCGNLRPNHQPFRSIIIDKTTGPVDLESLTLIEDAIHIYEACKLITPQELDEAKRADYAYIDSQLMRVSLEQFRLIINRNSDLTPAPLLLIN